MQVSMYSFYVHAPLVKMFSQLTAVLTGDYRPGCMLYTVTQLGALIIPSVANYSYTLLLPQPVITLR